MAEWRLAFPITSLDDRINMRSAVARLQADPFHIRTVLEERQDRQWIYRVEFEGEPENQEVLQLRRSYEHELPILTDPPYRYAFDTETIRPNLFDTLHRNSNGDVISPEVRLQVLQEFLSHTPRRMAPRNPLAPPLRRNIDYQSSGRRTFLVDTLPGRTTPYSDPPPPEVSDRHVGDGAIQYAADDASLTTRMLSRFGLGGGDPIPPAPSPPSPPPMWMAPGVWIRGRADPELFACIVSIAADRQVTIHNWRRLPEEVSLPVSVIERYWEKCPRPKEPTGRFERMLDDDFLEDMAPKTATVTIDGKPSFAIRLMQTFQKFFRPNGDSLPVNPEGAKTRFERLDRDE